MNGEKGRNDENYPGTNDRGPGTETSGTDEQGSERPLGPPDGNDNGVSDGEHSVEYQVNGEPQSCRQRELTVEQILQRAGTSAGIDTSDLGSYYLERLRDDRKFEQLTDTVDIRNGDQFLAVYSGRTPVA